jgi:hypothetical protein
MSVSTRRLQAAVFVNEAPEGRILPAQEIHRRLVHLREAAERRHYDVVFERLGDARPWEANRWVYQLMDAADAGTIHAVFVVGKADLGPPVTQVNWLLDRFERLGVWVLEAPLPAASVPSETSRSPEAARVTVGGTTATPSAES